MNKHVRILLIWAAVGGAGAAMCAAGQRLVLIDQDGSGPGGSNQMAMLALLESPDVKVLGITMVTGDAWRDEETLHTLRMLELTGHASVPVARGAVFPLVRTEEETRLGIALYGNQIWMGAWGKRTPDTSSGVTPPTGTSRVPRGRTARKARTAAGGIILKSAGKRRNCVPTRVSSR